MSRLFSLVEKSLFLLILFSMPKQRSIQIIKLQTKYGLTEFDNLSSEIVEENNAFIKLQKLKTQSESRVQLIVNLKQIVMSFRPNSTKIL